MAKHSFDLPFLHEDEEQQHAPRAIVLKAILPDDPSLATGSIDPVQEITALADTAGIDIVGAITQRRRTPGGAAYLGKGKIEELKELIEETDAQLVVVDDGLSPSQGRNIEERAETRVIDRTELIMDIFASHARTYQAKLQVELAQLRYSQSRLKRMWTHLSRFEGGIGMRGPGETQLETDRRIIRKKIGLLKERLRDIERQRETQHKSRSESFQVTLVGYTNAGKSTLMRRLTGAPVLIEDRLFSTLDTSTRKWEMDCARDVILSDTVGFIRKLPHGLVASFHATLMEAEEADLLLHVVDGSTAHVEVNVEAVEQTLKRISVADKPRVLLFNKVDLLPEDREIDLRYLLDRHPDSLRISAVADIGLEGPGSLTERVQELATADELVREYHLPPSRGDLVARLREMATIIEERYETDDVIVSARLSPEVAQRFEVLLTRNGL